MGPTLRILPAGNGTRVNSASSARPTQVVYQLSECAHEAKHRDLSMDAWIALCSELALTANIT